MRHIIESNYEYKHPLGTIIVDNVKIGITKNGRRSLPISEVERLSQLAVLNFLKCNYKNSIKDASFSLSPKIVKAIIAFLGVNQNEFGYLVGCQKSKISKILRSEQKISKSQALLALERLIMELAKPGHTRRLLGDKENITTRKTDNNILKELDELFCPNAA